MASKLNGTGHIGGYINPKLKSKVAKYAKKETRGNVTAMMEKMLEEGCERREAK